MQARGCVSQMLRPGPSKDQPPPAAARYQLSVPRLGSSNHRCVEAGRYHHNYHNYCYYRGYYYRLHTAVCYRPPRRLLPVTTAGVGWWWYRSDAERGASRAHPTRPPLQLQGTMRKFVIIFLLNFTGIRRDGHLLFEVKMYLQKGCIMVSGVGSS